MLEAPWESGQAISLSDSMRVSSTGSQSVVEPPPLTSLAHTYTTVACGSAAIQGLHRLMILSAKCHFSVRLSDLSPVSNRWFLWEVFWSVHSAGGGILGSTLCPEKESLISKCHMWQVTGRDEVVKN